MDSGLPRRPLCHPPPNHPIWFSSSGSTSPTTQKPITIRENHISHPQPRYYYYSGQEEHFDPIQVFSSPCWHYCFYDNYYAGWEEGVIEDYEVQAALKIRHKPGSYGIGQQTFYCLEYERPRICFHEAGEEHDERAMEFYTKDPTSIVIEGIVMRLRRMGDGEERRIGRNDDDA
eukprot:m.271524 g.271524  ORF g.271524 m.271524 type:complete len:174 (+) comp53217_c0_seq1:40-561(+)